MPRLGEEDYLNGPILQGLDKIEQELNEFRIKLEQLRKGYIEIASAYHLIHHFIGNHQHNMGEDWLKCEAMTCTSHRQYLSTLELSFK